MLVSKNGRSLDRLDEGANANASTGSTSGNAIEPTASRGHEAIIELLIEYGADVNALMGRYPRVLQVRGYSRSPKAIELLLKHNCDVARIGFMSCVSQLLDAGAHPNIADGLGSTALHLVALATSIDLSSVHLALSLGTYLLPHPKNTNPRRVQMQSPHLVIRLFIILYTPAESKLSMSRIPQALAQSFLICMVRPVQIGTFPSENNSAR